MTQQLRYSIKRLLPLLAVLLFFLFAQQHAVQHSISHIQDEITHALKHDKSGQQNICKECLSLINLPDAILASNSLVLSIQVILPLVVRHIATAYLKSSCHRYTARAPPLKDILLNR